MFSRLLHNEKVANGIGHSMNKNSAHCIFIGTIDSAAKIFEYSCFPVCSALQTVPLVIFYRQMIIFCSPCTLVSMNKQQEYRWSNDRRVGLVHLIYNSPSTDSLTERAKRSHILICMFEIMAQRVSLFHLIYNHVIFWCSSFCTL